MVKISEPHSPAPNPAADLQAKITRAIALHKQGNLAAAESIYREVLQQQPNHVSAMHLLGVVALQSQHPDWAIDLIEKAIRLKPDFAEAFNNRAKALLDMKRSDDALASFDRAIALKPDFVEAYCNRGMALKKLNRPEEALASYDQAIAHKPDYALAYSNRGNALLALVRLDEALASFDRAIALKPDYAEAHWSQSLCLLLMGRFEQGWRQYEWRKKCSEAIAARSFPQPLWLGDEDIAGKTLFFWWEQGLGDSIQFFRYLKLVEARGAKVVFAAQESLLELLKPNSPTVEFIGPDDVPAQFDFHCPLLSLPLAFRTTLATIPAQQQYLKADENRRALWASRLGEKTRTRIGLVWSGSSANANDQNRSIALEQFLPILGPNADWIGLQDDIRHDDIFALRQSGRIAYFGENLRDFSDTAALIDLMDVVVTVDTAVAHLAGAMGKPVWILRSHRPEWRWLLDRDDSPWYPSARLFGQRQLGDWAEVIERVGNELRTVFGR